MKAKDLFKKIEAVNFIYGSTHAGAMVYITCVVASTCKPSEMLPVRESKPLNERFRSWDRFASTVAFELSQDICDFIGSGELKYAKGNKSFYLENADWIIVFDVWDE